MKKTTRKLTLRRDTLCALDSASSRQAGGASGGLACATVGTNCATAICTITQGNGYTCAFTCNACPTQGNCSDAC